VAVLRGSVQVRPLDETELGKNGDIWSCGRIIPETVEDMAQPIIGSHIRGVDWYQFR